MQCSYHYSPQVMKFEPALIIRPPINTAIFFYPLVTVLKMGLCTVLIFHWIVIYSVGGTILSSVWTTGAWRRTTRELHVSFMTIKQHNWTAGPQDLKLSPLAMILMCNWSVDSLTDKKWYLFFVTGTTTWWCCHIPQLKENKPVHVHQYKEHCHMHAGVGWVGWDANYKKYLIYRPAKKNNAMNPGCGTEVKTNMFLPDSCLTVWQGVAKVRLKIPTNLYSKYRSTKLIISSLQNSHYLGNSLIPSLRE